MEKSRETTENNSDRENCTDMSTMDYPIISDYSLFDDFSITAGYTQHERMAEAEEERSRLCVDRDCG
ncbi:hypothetical protein Dform_01358 [Dehalogenimonas formicexedens]|uniref:Uncharacterized protein n=1 Tax=Dehalogenimonas formicexedens TaxID=1839801 RepID=A0A1P8F8F5_9CHLR|nr:hypothetical protein [Dehalogenimonas formicexedens]APV44682.1 hypothetical protein Dform_01358 [Dehalogenimonas formicexedens]